MSYRRSIVTKSLSPAIFEILASKCIGGHDLDLSGSSDVIGHVTIGLAMVHFLLVKDISEYLGISRKPLEIDPSLYL